MAVTIDYKQSNVISWSYMETTTPSVVDDSITGGGALNISMKYNHDGEFIQGDDVSFNLGSLGTLSGHVQTSSFQGGDGMETTMSLSIPTLLVALSTNRILPLVMNMNMLQIIRAYMGTVFNTLPPITATIPLSTNYTFVSYEGNVWDALCEMAAVYGFQIVVNNTGIVIQPLGTTSPSFSEESQYLLGVGSPPSMTLNEGNLGLHNEITYTNQRAINSGSPSGVLTNLSTNPSVETNATGWLGRSVTEPWIVSQSHQRSNAWSYDGSWSYRSQMTTAGYSNVNVEMLIWMPTTSVSLGDRVTIGAASHFTHDAPESGMIEIIDGPLLGYELLTASNTVVASYLWRGIQDGVFTQRTTPAITAEQVAEGVTQIRPWVGLRWLKPNPTTGISITLNLFADVAFISKDGAVGYFDGNSPSASWTGAVNNSTSTMPNNNNTPLYDAMTDNRVMQVGVNDTETYVIKNDENGYYALSLNPLIPASGVPVSTGYYHITDGLHLPIAPAAWLSYGGRVVAQFNEYNELEIVVTGPREEIPGTEAPYYLASSEGDTRIPQIRVAGVGVVTTPTVEKILTGADPTHVHNDVAHQISSPWITTKSQAWDVAADMGYKSTLATPQVSFTVPLAKIPGFGIAAGGIIRFKDANYRIVSISMSTAGATFTLSPWTTLQDFHNNWVRAGGTVGDFDAEWSGRYVRDLSLKPLKRSN